jgi:hypothetical protein
MDDTEILELYKILKRGFKNSDWDLIQESIDYVTEYIDIDDCEETTDDSN